MTQDKLAEALGVSRQAVAKWERGDSYPDIQRLIAVADLFDVTLDSLLRDKPDIALDVSSNSVSQAIRSDEALINEGLRGAMECSDPDQEINAFLAFLGEQLHAERVYIFEQQVASENFSNTYEWCSAGVKPEIDFLQHVPRQDIAPWLDAFENDEPIYIYDLNDIRDSDSVVYQWLEPQGITSLVALQLFEGRCFFGADNPPRAFIEQTAMFMEIAAHFVESMLHSRDIMRDLKLETEKHSLLYRMSNSIEYSYDVLTGAVKIDSSASNLFASLTEVTSFYDLEILLKAHPECRDHILIDGIQHVKDTHEGTFTDILVKKGEDCYWLRVAFCPVVDVTGTLRQIFGVIEDRSAQHEVIRRVNAYNTWLSGGMHVCHLSEPIFLEYASDNLCKLVGYSREEFEEHVGRDYSVLINPDDLPAFAQFVEKVAAKEGKETVEYGLIHKNGNIIRVIDTMESIRDGNGTMYGYANVTDITDLRESLDEAKAREHYAQMRIDRQYEIMEALGRDYLNIFSIDMEREEARVLKLEGYVTAGMKEHIAAPLSYQEFYKRYVHDRVHPDDVDMMLRALSPEKVCRELSRSEEYSLSYRIVDEGEMHYCRFKYMRSKNDDNNIIAAFSNIDDLMAREIADRTALEFEAGKVSALLKVFRSVYRVDLENETYAELICGQPNIQRAVGMGGSAREVIDSLCASQNCNKSTCKLRQFLDVTTARERLEDTEQVAIQAKTAYSGWTEFFLIAGEKNSHDELVSCYLASRSIETQKAREFRAQKALRDSRSREEKANDEARRDVLTGLLNRRAYEQALEDLMDADAIGVIYCDVNGLKLANDNYGHKAGDKLLLKFADILKKHFSNDCIYRIGGDEFVVLAPRVSQEGLERRVGELRASVVAAQGIASIGVGFGTGSELGEQILQAEGSMYVEKSRAKNRRRR